MTDHTTDTEYDFIIIGAGSAGCAVAGRLAEDPDVSVLVIEAGGRDWNPLIKVPFGVLTLVNTDWVNWSFDGEPEPSLDGRSLPVPRGKVVGGTSSINGMFWVRGAAADFDAWADEGNDGWSYAQVLPYFMRSETFEDGADNIRGGQGPMPVRWARYEHQLYDAFAAAGKELNYPATSDYNGAQQEGFHRLQHNHSLKTGRRASAADAYLRPAMKKPNVTVMTKTRLARVVFDKHRARGVDVVSGKNNTPGRINARREIILSMGSIQTPQGLMLSGIGDADELRRLDLPVIADLKGVGKNLQDHVGTGVEVKSKEPISLPNETRGFRGITAMYRAWFHGDGPASHLPFDSAAFLKSDDTLKAPDLQFFMVPMPLIPVGETQLPPWDGHSVFWCDLTPESRGSVSLKSSNPLDAPSIQFNPLATDRDKAIQRRAVRMAREFYSTNALQGLWKSEETPGADCTSDAEIDKYVKQTLRSHYHPVGTARMGNDADAVVDSSLRVHGVEGLRVVDASVMPTITRGNTNAPTIMIAEKAADMIRNG